MTRMPSAEPPSIFAANDDDRPADLVARVEAAVAATGLACHGLVAAGPEDGLPGLSDGRRVGALMLLGWRGSSSWEAFAGSPEHHDGRPDPLDRWSRRVIGGLAEAFRLAAFFPFEGPPWWPFQRWAARTATIFPSPIGLDIDGEVGLWHAHRGALGLPEGTPVAAARPRTPPCAVCGDQPCLSACPIGAFDGRGYDAERCRARLMGADGEICRREGCRARLACPVGRESRYGGEQIRFLMDAWLRAPAFGPGPARGAVPETSDPEESR
jgi:hypothetical protein